MREVIFFKFSQELSEREREKKIGKKEDYNKRETLMRNNFPSEDYYSFEIKDKVVCGNMFNVDMLALRKKEDWSDYENLLARKTVSNQPCLLIVINYNLKMAFSGGTLNFRLWQAVSYDVPPDSGDNRIELRGVVEDNENRDIPKINYISLWMHHEELKLK
ncbi:17635_t:CDS:2 [Gigaspora margarita]|uniref:17635_t:CDS:1 n=1 Tax=Gigaspora margarita TaxID=4874 RepID=A0ABM8VXE3_GIGMA|nr:17635_t:CDS:2 [Gigaspora margarita]